MNSVILGFYVFIFSKPLKSCFNYVFILYHPPSASLYLFLNQLCCSEDRNSCT